MSSLDGVAYQYMNVGVFSVSDDSWPVYHYINVGVVQTLDDTWTVYHYLNVTEDPPYPTLWFLKPTFGRAGDTIGIYGIGFGSTQSEFSGVVQVNYGLPIGWQNVPILSWTTVGANGDAYGPDRHLDQILGEIDQEHTLVEIQVPADAVPPGYPVRVRINNG